MSSFEDRLSQRQRGFKKSIDAAGARRKREDATVQLRKQTREETLRRKRMIDDFYPGQRLSPFDGMPNALQTIAVLAYSICGDNSPPQVQFQATQNLRRLLSVKENPPTQEVINAGVLPRIVQFMTDVSRTGLQIEAEWVLNIIASGRSEHTWAVVDAGALPVFAQLVEAPHEDVQVQAVWALGNIAAESSHLRDMATQLGCVHRIVKVIHESQTKAITNNAAWVLSNLCMGKPSPPLEAVTPALSTLSQLINSSDEEVLVDACWALACITEGESERIEAVIRAGVCQRLVNLLEHESLMVQVPALRAVGNIVLGDENQVEIILLCEPLPLLMQLLAHQSNAIKKDACWAISNIMGGNYDQVQHVIDNGLIPPVIHLLRTGAFDAKREAAWALANATACQVPEQIEYLVQCGCIAPLVDLLGVSDVKVKGVALSALENIFRVGQYQQLHMGLEENPIMALVEEAEGLARIEALQEDSNDRISAMAMKILDEQFP